MSFAILAIILGVALFDTVVGIRLLRSSRPYDVNGAGTLWARSAPALFERDPALARSLFGRLGAFSLHTGIATAVWALASEGRPFERLALLVTYTLTGLAFFHGDRRDFAGTPYFRIKQALGGLWSLALAGQIALVAAG